jgi:hypothetical protein
MRLPVLVLLLGMAATADAAAEPRADLPLQDAIRITGTEADALIRQDFLRFDPLYDRHRKPLADRLDQLRARLIGIQAAGNEMECSTEIHLEAEWLLRYTALWDRLSQRLDDLAESLDHRDQAFATRQSPDDGLWGVCYEKPFFKVEATVLGLIQLEAVGQKPRYAVRLPEPYDHPLETFARVSEMLVSDIARDGVDNRGQLGNLGTVAALQYLKAYMQGYLDEVGGLPRNEGGWGARAGLYTRLFESFLDLWQDPVTGYWGPLYRHEGRLYRVPDLSDTFHIISYRKGRIEHWPEVVRTTLAIEDQPYPFGWMHDGSFVNHNNYDVAKIMKLGWAHMSAAERQLAAQKIREMLRWTLSSSLRADGSFATVPAFFSSMGADFYFGVAFLKTIGFWDKSERFWTDQAFPQAAEVCERVKTKLTAMSLKSLDSETALAQLAASC